jgi:RNA polymerase sigma-70 factor (ECF subfamily)
VTFHSFATQPASRPGRTGSSYAPASRRAKRHRRWAPNLRLLVEPAADDDLSSVVGRDQLERGFRHLSIDHRTAVVLHHYLDLPLERVAEILDIPVGTAHSRLHYAMRALRAALEADTRPAAREVIG